MPTEDRNELAVTETGAQDMAIADTVRAILEPVMESIATLLRHNTEAMEQIAAAQQLASDRISALEKQVRLQTPVSRTQERYIGDAIRARAVEILDGKGYSGDRKAVTKLAGCIRKSVLSRYGVGSMREVPAYDYRTILAQAGMWNDAIVIRSIVKEARERVDLADPEPAADGAGTDAGAGADR